MDSKRLYFLDNLKMFIVVLMIVFHLAMCYMEYAPEWWYVVDKAHLSLFFTGFVVWADMFIMPMMFFVAGYFGLMSLARHGDGKWWKSKLLRIALPWVVGASLFAGPTTYMMFLSQNIPMDFWTFYTTLFIYNPEAGGPGLFFSHVQYWYLGVLMLMYVLLYGYTKLKPEFLERQSVSIPSNLLLMSVFVFFLINTISLDIITGNDDLWSHFYYFIVYQPCRILTFPVVFFLGAYAWRHQWFVAGGYRPSLAPWTSGFAIFTLAYPLWVLFGVFVVGPTLQFVVIKAVLHSCLLMTAMFGLLAIFQTYFDGTSKLWGELAANSYTMYYCHMQVVFPITYLLLPLDVPSIPKWVITSIIGLIACYIVSKVLLQLPCFAGSKKAKTV